MQLHVKTPKGKKNTFGKYKYRTAEDILASVKEELIKERYPKDCILLTNVELKDVQDRLFVCVTATLRVGKEEVLSQGLAEHAQNKKGMDEAQLTGSTTTYARKYALQNLFGIDESEDDLDNGDNTTNVQKVANICNSETKEILRAENEKQFMRIKDAIEACESVVEIEALVVTEKPNINKLAKYAKDLFAKLKDCKEVMIDIIEPKDE